MFIIFTVLVLPVIANSCDRETQFEKDGQCCPMCPPGTHMVSNIACQSSVCIDCKDGEYQDAYNMETKCKRQPDCDPNLYVMKQANQSKTKRTPCQCVPGHYCSSEQCETCVKLTVCQAGQRIKTEGTRISDTECESCPSGSFSNTSASTCQEWTQCAAGHTETVQGSSTSDRICEAQVNVKAVVCSLVAVLFLAVVGVLIYCYKRGKMASKDLQEKLQQHCGVFCKDLRNVQPLDDVALENESHTPINQPEEDTEDQLKHGVSANGMPVRQDNSKASLLSQPETAASLGSC